jgi:hypothetical protein
MATLTESRYLLVLILIMVVTQLFQELVESFGAKFLISVLRAAYSFNCSAMSPNVPDSFSYTPM